MTLRRLREGEMLQRGSAVVERGSVSSYSMLLDQRETPGNQILSSVSVRLEDGPLLASGTQVWIHAGALTPTPLRDVTIECPLGATFYNTSLGQVQLTQSPW